MRLDLPPELDGQQVIWQPWERSPEPSHIPLDCAACDYDRAPSMAFGKVGKRLAYSAVRCPRCQETRIYRLAGGVPSLALYVPPVCGAPPATRTITIPEDGLYRIEAGEVTRIYQQTGAAVQVEVGDRTYVIPDGTWTVIEFDTEDL